MTERPQTIISVIKATTDHIPRITEIYAHHVLYGLASFEETPPDAFEMTRRLNTITNDGYPYFAATDETGTVLGYGYLASFRPRPAYRFTVENSVYIDQKCIGLGIGKKLLNALIVEGTKLGFRQMIAVIGDSDNAASIGLHRSFGFTNCGINPAVGLKFGRWVDSVTMQLALGDGAETLP